jgi:site-specific DNA recombinase
MRSKLGSATCSANYLETTKGYIAMAATVRAALYLWVLTGRQTDSDLSIPDQRRQAKGYCASSDYVEPGVSATDDRQPEFRHMVEAATIR